MEDGMPTRMRMLTVRLPEEQIARLTALAGALEVPAAEEVRRAVEERIDKMTRDPEVQAKLEAAWERDRRVIEGLIRRGTH